MSKYLSYYYQYIQWIRFHNLQFANMNHDERIVTVSDDDNMDKKNDKPDNQPISNPVYRYVCHSDIKKLYIFECELQWQCADDDNSSSSTMKNKRRISTETQTVKPNNARHETVCNNSDTRVMKNKEPLHPSNDDIVVLLSRFSRAFLYGLLGLKEMFPNNGTKGTNTQHQWYRNFLSEGILQLERCEVPNILSQNRDLKVYEMIPALENYWFSALVDNLLCHMHFAIAYDINTDATNPDGNYHVVVRHGKVTNHQEDNTRYYVYGNEPQNPERRLIH